MGQSQSDVLIEDFCSACEKGHLERVASMLEQGSVGVNARHPSSGWTGLHYASEACRVEVAQLLLQRGADVNAVTRDAWQCTSLHLSLSGNPSPLLMVATLLRAGANPNVYSAPSQQQGQGQGGGGEKISPLHLALETGDALCVRALLRRGAVVDEKCKTIPISDKKVREMLFGKGKEDDEGGGVSSSSHHGYDNDDGDDGMRMTEIVVDSGNYHHHHHHEEDNNNDDDAPLLSSGPTMTTSFVDGTVVEDSVKSLNRMSNMKEKRNSSKKKKMMIPLVARGDEEKVVVPKREVTEEDIRVACDVLKLVSMSNLSPSALAQINHFYATQLELCIVEIKKRSADRKDPIPINLIDDDDED